MERQELQNRRAVNQIWNGAGRYDVQPEQAAFDEDGDPQETEYELVGTTEADVYKNKISNESPLGKALIGHREGETVTVVAPSCSYPIKIIAIKRA